MVSTPIREMTKNSPIPPPTCPPELVFAFYQIELSEDSRITAALFLIYIPQTPDGLEDFKTWTVVPI
nr:MAG TPA: hypothetical protein [Caudoviricetes sp.]